MTNKLVIYVMAALMLFASCALLQSVLGKDKVITTEGNLKPGSESITIPLRDIDPAVKKVLDDKFPGEEIVLADKKDLKENGVGFPITVETGFWGDLFAFVGRIGGMFFPPLLALEAIGAVLFKRKREHWLSVLKAIIPANGKIEVVKALSSIGKAIGVTHSSPSSAAAHKEIKNENTETAA